MKVIIKNITMSVFGPDVLCPAPSIRDWEGIKESLDKDTTPKFKIISDFVGKPLEILDTYRGWNLYLQGGVTVIRINPGTPGGNGLVSLPDKKTVETARLIWRNEAVYDCELEYVV